MLSSFPKPVVVAGIDGSPAAVDAAIWAVDQAIDRDLPLRLVYVIDRDDHADIDAEAQARRIATAAVAMRHALRAVEATERPVEIEMEILQGRPVQTLLQAANSAAILCIGARGLKHSTSGRIGSTAAALTEAAHCPVAIVRTHRPHHCRDRAVVIEITDNAAGSVVLQRGLDEARRRRAPVWVLTPARTYPDVSAQWERRFAEWRVRYPEVDITAVGNNGDTLRYLAAHADSVQLVVAGRGRPGGLTELVGSPGNSALRDTDCSILVCEPQNAL
ncbi:nucleotide-binding universal stress UspA family protein [Mycolicibacterium iranicum]|uniref:Nucleotide-binding universal stress UspA family protein n=1 Tax=Mycolicibacterium iranicum TaxID=912594 RepID=A0A839Q7Y6_MYCIR|nr:universal stress protein [Mycolicibacterium iranicum]MBB2990336.1 nucleotide-binding universal stress UspA family protein [Mycolicibacterium iranicum]